MSLVPSLLQAIIRVDGEALVMHVGEKPYVVSPNGQVDLATRGLTFEAVNGLVAQLLPPDALKALEDVGATQFELPNLEEFPGEHFTVTAARGGDDVWAEIRRRQVPDEDLVPADIFTGLPVVAAPVSETGVGDDLTLPKEDQLWPARPAPESMLEVPASIVGDIAAAPRAPEPEPIAPPEAIALPSEAIAPPSEVIATPPSEAIAAPPSEAIAPTPHEATVLVPMVVPPPVAAAEPTSIAAVEFAPTQEPIDSAPTQEPVESVSALESPDAAPAAAPVDTAASPDGAADPPVLEPPSAVRSWLETLSPADVWGRPELWSMRSGGRIGIPESSSTEHVSDDRAASATTGDPAPEAIAAPPTPVAEVEPDGVAAPVAPVAHVEPEAIDVPLVPAPEAAPEPVAALAPVAAVESEPTASAPIPASAEVERPESAGPLPQAADDEREAAAASAAPPVLAAADPIVPVSIVSPDAHSQAEPEGSAAPAVHEPVVLEASAPEPAAPSTPDAIPSISLAAAIPETAATVPVSEPVMSTLPPDASMSATPTGPMALPRDMFDAPPAAGASAGRETFQETADAGLPAGGSYVPFPSLSAPSQPAVVLPIGRGGREMTAHAEQGHAALERLLKLAASRGASTLYLSSNARPSARLDGDIQTLDGTSVLSADEVDALLLGAVPEPMRSAPSAEWVWDLADVGRVRCTSFRDHRGPGAVFRIVPVRVQNATQLGLSREIQGLASEADGLVLVSGPRANGKSTLISSFVDLINRTRRDYVITIEHEINVAHERLGAFVSQREVRGGTEEMLAAARAALREDPDVLVLDDLRSSALMTLALDAAAAGQLVIASVPAHHATGAVERLIDLYQPEHRRQVQLSLAQNLRGVVSQVLLRKSGGGRVAAREVLLNTPLVESLLAEGRTEQLPLAI
ncbi:MAG: ATPase, T2SS/T4P/T4SS family, partial [Vicinamibacterales bacterium]